MLRVQWRWDTKKQAIYILESGQQQQKSTR